MTSSVTSCSSCAPVDDEVKKLLDSLKVDDATKARLELWTRLNCMNVAYLAKIADPEAQARAYNLPATPLEQLVSASKRHVVFKSTADIPPPTRILLSTSDFRSLRTSGGFYVDKTQEISGLVDTRRKILVTRPRKFGKTFLCSTLEALFECDRSFFKGLWVDGQDGGKDRWNWESPRPVVRLDLSLARTRCLNSYLVHSLHKIGRRYGVEWKRVAVGDNSAVAHLIALMREFQKLFPGLDPAVIIDEYDSPLNNISPASSTSHVLQFPGMPKFLH